MKKTVSFTSEKFRTLLELVYLGEWMINGHKNYDERIERYDEMLNYLFSLAGQFDLENVSLPHDPQFPTADFEQEMDEEYISNYDDLTFWDELAEVLTKKIMRTQYSSEKIQSMTPDERFLTYFRIEDEVNIYLEKYGLDEILLPSNLLIAAKKVGAEVPG